MKKLPLRHLRKSSLFWTHREQDCVRILFCLWNSLNNRCKKSADKRCCQVLRNNKRIERLIYVSCSPQGAMRSFVDLCRAESNAYGGVPFFPTQAIAVDLFPDTPHCELIVVLERYNLVSDPSRNQPQSNSDITE